MPIPRLEAYLCEVELLKAAVTSPYGIVVAVSDNHLAQDRFRQAQQAFPESKGIAVRNSFDSPGEELWLIKHAQLPARARPATLADILPLIP